MTPPPRRSGPTAASWIFIKSPFFIERWIYFSPPEKALQEQMCGNSLIFKWRENGLYRPCCISRNTSTQSPISSKWGWVTHSGNSSSLPSSGWQKWSHLRGAHLVTWHNNDCGCATFTESSSRHITTCSLLRRLLALTADIRLRCPRISRRCRRSCGNVSGRTCLWPHGGPYCRHITTCSEHYYWGICSVFGQNTRNMHLQNPLSTQDKIRHVKWKRARELCWMAATTWAYNRLLFSRCSCEYSHYWTLSALQICNESPS